MRTLFVAGLALYIVSQGRVVNGGEAEPSVDRQFEN